jgi:hypothetical protein
MDIVLNEGLESGLKKIAWNRPLNSLKFQVRT